MTILITVLTNSFAMVAANSVEGKKLGSTFGTSYELTGDFRTSISRGSEHYINGQKRGHIYLFSAYEPYSLDPASISMGSSIPQICPSEPNFSKNHTLTSAGCYLSLRAYDVAKFGSRSYRCYNES